MRKWFQYRLVDLFAATAAVACAFAGVSLFGLMRLPLVLAVVLSFFVIWLFRRDPFHPFLASPFGGALGGFLGATLLLLLGHKLRLGGFRQPPAESPEILLLYAGQGFLIGFVIAWALVLLIVEVRLAIKGL